MSINADCAKVIGVIESCKNSDQIRIADNMVGCFFKKYKSSHNDYWLCLHDINTAAIKKSKTVRA
jgi:uncharacterized protein (DUF1697 family)